MLALTAEGVGGRKSFVKLILAIVPDEETVDRITETLKMSGVDIDDPDSP